MPEICYDKTMSRASIHKKVPFYNSPVDQLTQDLLQARKARDRITVEALQAALTRITNAEAVSATPNQTGVVGVGTTEATRKVLSDEEILDIIYEELKELTEAHASMESHPDHPYALNLAKKIAILSRYTTA
jgi:uncharacterized protein